MLEKKKETKYMHKEDPNIVRPIIPSRIKGKAQFECKDGLITVDTRYDVTRCVGSGAYGHVFAAKDAKILWCPQYCPRSNLPRIVYCLPATAREPAPYCCVG